MALQRALIQRAAEILGGPQRLAELLRVDLGVLRRWQFGELRLPESTFLQLVDVVLKDDVARARTDRRQHARTHALPDQLFAASRRDKATAG